MVFLNTPRDTVHGIFILEANSKDSGKILYKTFFPILQYLKQYKIYIFVLQLV